MQIALHRTLPRLFSRTLSVMATSSSSSASTASASSTVSYPSPVIIQGERVEPVWTPSHELGEGGLWHPTLQTYMHVDIYGPSKHCAGPAVYLHNPYKNNEFKVYPVPSFCGTVVPCKDSSKALVSLKNGIHSLDLETGEIKFLTNPDGKEENRWNDGKCSPEGRFWGGTMGVPGKVLPKVGGLYVLNTDGTTRKALSDITISNGLAWSPDNKTFYYIDTPTGYVNAFDYDTVTGNLSNQRIAFHIPPGTGHPDGSCIDSDGNLWIAQWGGWRVVAYRPHDGSIVAEVHVPAAHVSSCTFGGPDLKDLYITTAKEHLTEDERKAQPHAGDIFLVRNVGWTGVPANVYQG